MLTINNYAFVKFILIIIDIIGCLGCFYIVHKQEIFKKTTIFFIGLGCLFFWALLADIGIYTMTYYNTVFLEPFRTLSDRTIITVLVLFMCSKGE